MGLQGTICGGGRYDYLIEQMAAGARSRVGRWERVLSCSRKARPPSGLPMFYAIVPDGRVAILCSNSPPSNCVDSRFASKCMRRLRLGGHGQHEVAVQEGLTPAAPPTRWCFDDELSMAGDRRRYEMAQASRPASAGISSQMGGHPNQPLILQLHSMANHLDLEEQEHSLTSSNIFGIPGHPISRLVICRWAVAAWNGYQYWQTCQARSGRHCFV